MFERNLLIDYFLSNCLCFTSPSTRLSQHHISRFIASKMRCVYLSLCRKACSKADLSRWSQPYVEDEDDYVHLFSQ